MKSLSRKQMELSLDDIASYQKPSEFEPKFRDFPLGSVITLQKQHTMSDAVFNRLAGFIKEKLGIKLHDGKKAMLQSRVLKRLRILDLSSFEAYSDYLFSPVGMTEELQHLLNAVTTNKTDFFREPKHFDFLVNNALPDMVQKYGTGVKYMAKIWSAGCSNGKEVYTLAMVLSEFAEKVPDFKFYILGTDISTQVLDQAASGVYDEDEADVIPIHLKKKYLLKSKDRAKKLVRVTSQIRSRVMFKRLNLMDETYSTPEKIDIIFCRNVFIYFDRPTQQYVLDKLCQKLVPGGYLFSGHSEGLNGFNKYLGSVVHAVFKKDENID